MTILRTTLILLLFSSGLLVQADNGNLSDIANGYIESLGDSQHDSQFVLDDEERYDWHYVPRGRPGLSLRNMDEDQETHVHGLLWFSLSRQGYAKAIDTLEAETFTDIIMSRQHTGLYFPTFFGEPSPTGLWGWRFEGHHLSLNFLVENNEVVRATPAFWGSNPAVVTFGEERGRRFLLAEELLGFKLINSLEGKDREQAIIDERAFRDILSGTEREAEVPPVEGLRFTDMPEESRWIADQLLQVYLGSFTSLVANDMRERIREAGYDKLYFAWAGGLNEGERHYYRIHGPTILIEFDNVQNNANHIHSVVRDLEKDFGNDLLRKHYETADTHHGHDH